MKKYILPLILVIIVITSCNQGIGFISEYLNAGNLTEQLFTIQTDKDTTVKTADGIIISIPANSIKAEVNTVTLQVKEALTLAEMLKAGLTTQAGKDILSSDGMFFIGTKEQSTITGAIHVKVPTADANKKMQLYKGAEKDGKIDWQAPTPIAKTITPLSDSGEVLFKTNCTSCHAVDKKLVGPALAWMDKRKSREWVRAFTRNNGKVLASGDGYANFLLCEYRLAMPVFENLTDRDVDAIYTYVDKVAKEKGIPEPLANQLDEYDSCEYYRTYYTGLTEKRDSLVNENGPMVKVEYSVPTVTSVAGSVAFMSGITSNFVTIPQYDAEYYRFNVTTYGWYNIDILWKKENGEQESTLIARIHGEYTEKIKVYLVIPLAKVFTPGGFVSNGKDFGFDKDDGTIPLPQNTNAYIIALSEQKEKLYYSEQQFTTSLNQTINLSLKETDKQTVLASFASMQLNNIKMGVEKTKNFDGIKGVDTELAKLQERLSHCGCKADSAYLPVTNEAMPAKK